MGSIDGLVDNAGTYAAHFPYAGLPASPRLRVAVLTCMDARIDPAAILGLRPGDAHVLRNAGAVLTPDVRRSLAISQRKLGTTSVAVIRHTGCGLLNLDAGDFLDTIAAETGHRPAWPVYAFTDLAADLLDSLADLRTDTAIPHRDDIRGFVYDAQRTGRLTELGQGELRQAA